MTDSTRSSVTSTTKERSVGGSVDPLLATLGLIGLTIVIAIGVGFVAGVAAAFLVFLTGALLGAILLVWHSLRTLAGDAEVDEGLELATLSRGPANIELFEEKTRALRALKDLEQENALGKIDDADFAKLRDEYRAIAKDTMRALDAEVAPFREKAEALVREHLEKQKIDDQPVVEEDEDRVACPKCKTKNDEDATFCKKCGEKLSEPEGDDA